MWLFISIGVAEVSLEVPGIVHVNIYFDDFLKIS